MLQADIAGRTMLSPDRCPGKGSVLRDFQLCSTEGHSVLLSTYRGHFNLVLFLAGQSNLAAEFLSELNAHQAGHIFPAVFITDRWGEVFTSYRTAEGVSLPGAAEILSWVEFINRQCPECGPLEWPD